MRNLCRQCLCLDGVCLMIGALMLCANVFLGALPAMANEYVIGGGDRMHIFVWGEPDLSVQALVRPDGRVSIPAVGEIVAEGLTPLLLQEEITKRLSELVTAPLVTVSMTDMANSKVYIIGGGVAAGVYELRQKTTMLQMLAGMDLLRADLRAIYVQRDGERLKKDFYGLLHDGNMSQDIALQHNDVIFVPALPEPYVYVLGAVSAPRALAFKEGMTVLDALLECGGFNKFADKNDTVVLRRVEGGEERIKVRGKDLAQGKDLSQNVQLRRGDYIIANESFF